MKFTASQDIDVPVDVLFERLTAFDHIERLALRRGVEAVRVDRCEGVGSGLTWKIAFHMRGRRRDLISKLTEYQPPNRLRFTSQSDGAEGLLAVDFVALSRTRTRLALAATIKPRSLSARLLVQSMKLSRGKIKARILRRLDQLAYRIESEYGAPR